MFRFRTNTHQQFINAIALINQCTHQSIHQLNEVRIAYFAKTFINNYQCSILAEESEARTTEDITARASPRVFPEENESRVPPDCEPVRSGLREVALTDNELTSCIFRCENGPTDW